MQWLVDGGQAVIVEKVLLDMVPNEDPRFTPEESLELIDKFVAGLWFQTHGWNADLLGNGNVFVTALTQRVVQYSCLYKKHSEKQEV